MLIVFQCNVCIVLPETIIIDRIIRAVSNQATERETKRKENLCSSLQPHSGVQQELKLQILLINSPKQVCRKTRLQSILNLSSLVVSGYYYLWCEQMSYPILHPSQSHSSSKEYNQHNVWKYSCNLESYHQQNALSVWILT